MRQEIDTIIVATQNKGKLKEISELLPNLKLVTLSDLGFNDEIPEPYETFEENAKTKAMTIFKKYNMPVLAEDSGLCVAALGGKPGVHSARYAGEPKDDKANLEKLLAVMEGVEDRSAWYTAVVCLVIATDNIQFFNGKCLGTIANSPIGSNGFGYDPIFIPQGFEKSFGELGAEVKKKMSHRSKALFQLTVDS